MGIIIQLAEGINTKTLQEIIRGSEKNIDLVLDDLIDCILRGRRSVCSNPQIDYIHREMILEQPALRNPMYRRLLADDLSDSEHYMFMSNYQSQIKSFYEDTLPKALSLHRHHPAWREYLSMAIALKIGNF